MRFKVEVTKIEVMERWVRASDEEEAAHKIQEELQRPWAFAGQWETRATEVRVAEVEEAVDSAQAPHDRSNAMMLSLKDAAVELGIPLSALRSLTNEGEIEYTLVGARKYISRDSMTTYVRENSHRGR
jgi:hypothetical protein